MILLTVEEITALHNKLIDRTGGTHGLRDQSLLESAIYSAISGFDGSEAYPTIEEKAARLMYSLTNNHAFVDGNKRIGVFTMLMTLQLNNVKINYTQAELISLGLSLAEGKTGYIEILDWITKHKI
ncbi:MAG: type II toxin-antitoxin system death-on-curing family toxin [Ruminococcaceae bacterium]|nr:type II toxin-antitoxin system death-on-curing family toxin [Oscillospiraceae bacterium]